MALRWCEFDPHAVKNADQPMAIRAGFPLHLELFRLAKIPSLQAFTRRQIAQPNKAVKLRNQTSQSNRATKKRNHIAQANSD
jgi:hypothetical protein